MPSMVNHDWPRPMPPGVATMVNQRAKEIIEEIKAD